MFSREQAISRLKNNPNEKITHRLFGPDEYLYGRNGKVYDENEYLFEDWTSEGSGKHDGMRMRVGGNWENGWDLFKEDIDIVVKEYGRVSVMIPVGATAEDVEKAVIKAEAGGDAVFFKREWSYIKE